MIENGGDSLTECQTCGCESYADLMVACEVCGHAHSEQNDS